MRLETQTVVKALALLAIAVAGIVILRGVGGGEDARALPGAVPAADTAVVPSAGVEAPQPATASLEQPAADATEGPSSLADLQRMLEENPADVDLWRDLGVNLVAAHEYAGAAEAFAAAVELRPDDARLHSDLGTALLYQGLVRVARAEYRRALDLDPELAEAHFNLGITYSHSAPVDIDAALRSWRLATQFATDPDLVKIADEYIRAYGEGGTNGGATEPLPGSSPEPVSETDAEPDGAATGSAAQSAERSSDRRDARIGTARLDGE